MSELYHHGILGMKWGVRRYQNEDGSLTPEGQKRYSIDMDQNLRKKKDQRVDTSRPDPDRWAKEDLTRSKKLSEESSTLARKLRDADQGILKSRKKMDLKNMTDKDLRDAINREMLERQYSDMFGSSQISKGEMFAKNCLTGAASMLGVASSALGIALAIKELKGKG